MKLQFHKQQGLQLTSFINNVKGKIISLGKIIPIFTLFMRLNIYVHIWLLKSESHIGQPIATMGKFRIGLQEIFIWAKKKKKKEKDDFCFLTVRGMETKLPFDYLRKWSSFFEAIFKGGKTQSKIFKRNISTKFIFVTWFFFFI